MRLVLASFLLTGCVPGVSNGNSGSSGSPVDIEQPGGGGSSDSGASGDTAFNDTGGGVDTGSGGGGVNGRFVASGAFVGGISNPDMGEYPCEGDLAIDVDGGSFTGSATCTGSSAGVWDLTLYGSVDGGSFYGTADAVLESWDCLTYEDAVVSGGISAEGGYIEISVVSVWTECGYDYNWDFAGAADLMPG